MSSADPVDGPVSVLIIDDHRLFAQALAQALAEEPAIAIAGTAGSLAEGLAAVRGGPVDVVLLDHRLPDGTGLDGIAAIRQIAPHAAVVMVTATEDDRVLLRAVEAGCAGFITKSGDLDDLQQAVLRAAAGEATISPALLTRLLGRLSRGPSTVGTELTGREREVLACIVAGRSNADIAERLSLSVNTVRNHVQSVLTKVGAHSKLEAAAIAVREGLVDPAAG